MPWRPVCNALRLRRARQRGCRVGIAGLRGSDKGQCIRDTLRSGGRGVFRGDAWKPPFTGCKVQETLHGAAVHALAALHRVPAAFAGWLLYILRWTPGCVKDIHISLQIDRQTMFDGRIISVFCGAMSHFFAYF